MHRRTLRLGRWTRLIRSIQEIIASIYPRSGSTYLWDRIDPGNYCTNLRGQWIGKLESWEVVTEDSEDPEKNSARGAFSWKLRPHGFCFALLRKVRHRGVFKVGWVFTFAAAAYNLVRMRNLAIQAT